MLVLNQFKYKKFKRYLQYKKFLKGDYHERKKIF